MYSKGKKKQRNNCIFKEKWYKKSIIILKLQKLIHN